MKYNFSQQKYIPVLFGSDINSYSIARAFHEEYNYASIVFGKFKTTPFFYSKIVEFHILSELSDKHFLECIKAISLQYPEAILIVLGGGDDYLECISRNKDKLPKNTFAPFVDIEMMQTLIRKEEFYKLCKQYGIDHPHTHIVTKNTKEPPKDIVYPLILKPSNTVMYWEYPFDTQKKVYFVNSRDSLKKIIKSIYESGYTDSLIIQDFIPGTDDSMRVLTAYVGKDSKVKLVAIGNVLLEEHTPKGLGNHAVIMHEMNDDLVKKVTFFLEKIQYRGFANFDIKYDIRDGTYKFFEINVRQGRSNYYITGGGVNIAKLLIEDIEGTKKDLIVTTQSHVFTVIPLPAIAFFVKDIKKALQAYSLIVKGKYSNPLFYSKDFSLKRFFYIYKNTLSHYYKFIKYR